jgi:hypothetical protein
MNQNIDKKRGLVDRINLILNAASNEAQSLVLSAGKNRLSLEKRLDSSCSESMAGSLHYFVSFVSVTIMLLTIEPKDVNIES